MALMVDANGSVDADEHKPQRDGKSNCLLNPERPWFLP
jgi:hypothetical protein